MKVDQLSEPSARLEDCSEPKPPGGSDEALALDFAARHAGDFRYIAKLGRWRIWDGQRWADDQTMQAFDAARRICREAAAFKNDRPKQIASAKTVHAVQSLARADRRLAATIDQWDVDPLALNTPAGIIDLETGKRRPHDPDEFMTRMTAVAPAGKCPLWLQFLDRVTGGDEQLQRYLQRLAGYSLTGSIEEQMFAFAYGTGANGKGVFLSTIAGLMGDYHRIAPIEALTASGRDRHPTELAMLRGARLVTAQETEEGRRWAEARLKALTGGDRITARYMRGDFFEYDPQFTLVIAGNHKPGLRSVDEAIRRRLHLIPFGVTIPPAERDPALAEKLKSEWSGILAWAIEGCTQWRQKSLDAPPSVRAATDSYLNNQDAIGAWLAESTVADKSAWEVRKDLWASWKGWAERNGEYPLERKRFFDQLDSHNLEQRRRSTGDGYLGLRLLRIDHPDRNWNR